MFTKEALDKYKNILKPDVYNKMLLFVATPATQSGYCMRARTYTETTFPLTDLGKWGTHTFFYSSDQFPYYARVGMPCWGPLGGLKPEQTNLYIWCPTVKTVSSTLEAANPFYMYFKDLRAGMFEASASSDQQDEFMSKYGLMLTPSVLDSYVSPVVVGFLMASRYGALKLINSSATDTIVSRLLYIYDDKATLQQSPYGPFDVVGTWDAINNFVNGTFNVYHSKLKPFSVDPDYSCWDSPIKNLFTNHNIIGPGKFITGRATDITWDPWVERNESNGADWYGRNNGYSLDPKNGEVLKDLTKHLGVKYKTLPAEEVKTKVTEYILERLNTYAKAA